MANATGVGFFNSQKVVFKIANASIGAEMSGNTGFDNIKAFQSASS